jgi:hypothetical protein
MYGSFPWNPPSGWWAAYRAKILRDQLTLLAGFIDLLQTEIELSNPVSARISSQELFKVAKGFRSSWARHCSPTGCSETS